MCGQRQLRIFQMPRIDIGVFQQLDGIEVQAQRELFVIPEKLTADATRYISSAAGHEVFRLLHW